MCSRIAQKFYVPNADGYTSFDNYLLNKIYPIGSIYMSLNNANPGTFLGGTWERCANGQFLVGKSDASSGHFTSVSSTGVGVAGVTSITLTEANLPTHRHYVNFTSGSLAKSTFKLSQLMYSDTAGINSSSGSFSVSTSNNSDKVGGSGFSLNKRDYDVSFSAHTHSVTGYTDYVGNTTGINVVPPHLVVYVWRRKS